MIATMAEYPQWAGQRAIYKVDQDNNDFPPPVPKLRAWLDEAVAPYRFAKEWDERAAKQIEERHQLEAPQGEPKPQAPQGRTVTYGEALAMGMTRPIGVFEEAHGSAKRTVLYRG